MVGIKTDDKSSDKGRGGKALTKKQEIMQRNKKLHVVLAAHQQHIGALSQLRAQERAIQLGKPNGVAQAASRNGGQATAKGGQEAVIGKNEKPTEGWQLRTGRTRTVRKRKRRRKERGRSLW